MKVQEALKIDGSTKSAILCYGVFLSEELDVAFEALKLDCAGVNARIFKLLDDEWPNGVLLQELFISNDDYLLPAIVEAMSRMFSESGCVATICMYDAAFGTYDDILAPESSSQTYAFAFAGDEPTVVLDSEILVSEEWASMLACARGRLRNRLSERRQAPH